MKRRAKHRGIRFHTSTKPACAREPLRRREQWRAGCLFSERIGVGRLAEQHEATLVKYGDGARATNVDRPEEVAKRVGIERRDDDAIECAGGRREPPAQR